MYEFKNTVLNCGRTSLDSYLHLIVIHLIPLTIIPLTIIIIITIIITSLFLLFMYQLEEHVTYLVCEVELNKKKKKKKKHVSKLC